jgi:hypothetical protein
MYLTLNVRVICVLEMPRVFKKEWDSLWLICSLKNYFSKYMNLCFATVVSYCWRYLLMNVYKVTYCSIVGCLLDSLEPI